MFINGLIQIIQEVRASEMSTMSIVFGVIKMLCASFIGCASAMIPIVSGQVLLEK